MKNQWNPIIIVGNGITRTSIDLNKYKEETGFPLYSCNLGYQELNSDKIFAIDEKIKNHLKANRIPYEKVPTHMEYEPIQYNSNPPRNNAGMVAMQYAINEGYNHLLLYGFDFLIKNPEKKMSNIFHGNEYYSPETQCSYQDTFGRIRYLHWMLTENKNVLFEFIYDQDYDFELIDLYYENLRFKIND